MTEEDEEFNRVEREAKQRMEAVSAALDKKAENARQLGLDYEPAQQEPVAFFDPQSKGFYWAKPTKVIPPVTVDVEPLPLYTSPPAQKPQRWAVFCQGCRKEWSVSYPHPGKDICVDCDDKLAQQDSTCSNALRAQGKAYPRTCKKCGLGPCVADRVQPAQRTWVGLTDEEVMEIAFNFDVPSLVVRTAEAKLKEKNA